MYIKKPLNIQLFGEDGNQTPPAETQTPPAETQTTPNETNTQTVSKELYDKTASEVAELKRQLKEMQKAGKSEAELKDLDLQEKDKELQKRGEELQKLYIQLNLATAKSVIAPMQAKLNLNDNKDFDLILNSLVSDNGDMTSKYASAFNTLLETVYQKGIDDVEKNQWGSMANGIKSNSGKGGNNDSIKNFIKSIQPNTADTSSIKDKFKL